LTAVLQQCKTTVECCTQHCDSNVNVLHMSFFCKGYAKFVGLGTYILV